MTTRSMVLFCCQLLRATWHEDDKVCLCFILWETGKVRESQSDLKVQSHVDESKPRVSCIPSLRVSCSCLSLWFHSNKSYKIKPSNVNFNELVWPVAAIMAIPCSFWATQLYRIHDFHVLRHGLPSYVEVVKTFSFSQGNLGGEWRWGEQVMLLGSRWCQLIQKKPKERFWSKKQL